MATARLNWNGQMMTLTEIINSVELPKGVTPELVKARYNTKSWSLTRALTEPKHTVKQRANKARRSFY